MKVVDTFIYFIKDYIKPEDNINSNQYFFYLLKTILQFITNKFLYENTKRICRLLNMLECMLHVLSTFDKFFLTYCIDYFSSNVLDSFINIFNNKPEVREIIEGVINVFIGEIIKLNIHIKRELLGRFKKWFIVIIQNYTCNYHYDYELRIADGEEYRFQEWYYVEEFLFNIFIAMLPWFSTHCNGIKLLSEYISEGHDFFDNICKESINYDPYKHHSYENKTFLNYVKLHISIKFLDDMRQNAEGKLITPSWYDQLLDKMEGKIKYELLELIGNLVQILRENNT